jgi:hypothetical protein
MKKHLLLALSMFGIATANAQSPAHLVGQNYYEHQGSFYEITDSVRYVYGGTRLPQPIPSLYIWNYDTAKFFRNQPFGLRQSGYSDYTYDANGNATVLETYQLVATSYQLVQRISRTYDANHNVLTAEFETNASGTLQKQSRTTNTYNSNNQITTMLGENWNATTMQYEGRYRVTYTYNAANQLESTMSEMNSSGWVPSYRSVYTYAGGNNTELVEEIYSGTSWDALYKEQNTFDAAGNRIRSENQYRDMGSWEPTYAMNYRYDANRNILEREYLEWDGGSYMPVSTREYSYVPENYVLTEVAKTWNDIGGLYLPAAMDDSIRYYYNNSVSVGKAPVAMNGISIYPSPASTQVHLQMNLAGQQQYTVTLYDAAGRVVKFFANTGSGATRSSMDVHDVPSGNYVLVLNAGGTTAREKIVIAK